MNDKVFNKPLDRRLQELLDIRRSNSTLRNLTLPRIGQIDFSSNDFLSLSTSPQLKALYLQELQTGDLPQGSGGSRLLDGNSTYAENLERDIAEFHGAEAGLLFNSGFDANAGFFACVPQPGDILVYDELVHASVHDGMRLSRAASTVSFMHNSVDDLKGVLRRISEHDVSLSVKRNVIVAVESIYSMDGDVAPLKSILDAVDEVVGTQHGYVVVDEAHSTGVLGRKGRGLVCELELEHRIFARLHTFGKALASNGAIILGSPTLRHYLINYARPLIYTTFLSYPALALVRSSYKLLQSGQTVALQEHLHNLTGSLFQCLVSLYSTSAAVRTLLKIPHACPESPIFSIQLEHPRDLAMILQSRGMMVRPVVPPTVPLGTERVRVCLHAGNTVSQIQRLVDVLETWCERRLSEMDRGHAALTMAVAKL